MKTYVYFMLKREHQSDRFVETDLTTDNKWHDVWRKYEKMIPHEIIKWMKNDIIRARRDLIAEGNCGGYIP